jgi:hypothetical protein
MGVGIDSDDASDKWSDEVEVVIVTVPGSDLQQSVCRRGDLCDPAGERLELVLRGAEDLAVDRDETGVQRYWPGVRLGPARCPVPGARCPVPGAPP